MLGFGRAAGGNTDLVIPAFINTAMSQWFVYIFMMTLLVAAMPTLSSQFHAMGTSFSRDIIGTGVRTSENEEGQNPRNGLLVTKAGVILGIIISVILGYYLPISIIARGIALFFGVCAAVFLPIYICGLYWKRTSKAGSISGMIAGLAVSVFWMFFVHKANVSMLKLVVVLTGRESLFGFPWNAVDPILVVTIIVTLFTRPVPAAVVEKSFK